MKFWIESFHQLLYKQEGKWNKQSSQSENSVPDHKLCRKLIFISNSELQDSQWPNKGMPVKSSTATHHFWLNPPSCNKKACQLTSTQFGSQVIYLYTPELIYCAHEHSHKEVDRTSLVKVTRLWTCKGDLQSYTLRKEGIFTKNLC